MRKKIERTIGICHDCGKEVELINGVCKTCKIRKMNAERRGRPYVPYINLSEKEKQKVISLQKAQIVLQEKLKQKKEKTEEVEETKEKISFTLPVAENYYQMKAEKNPAVTHVTKIPVAQTLPVSTPKELEEKEENDILSNMTDFILILRNYGCEIPTDTLKDILNVLISTDKLKDVFMTVAKDDSQQAILDLEQALNVIERKLQHEWEYNGFQESDDIKFKGFLTWRRVLKGSIFFWKKLYQTNALIELQRAWNAYTTDPNDKILMAGDKIDSSLKRFQITTDSISTILNTRRPFTRVFYATSREEAYDMFKKWMADRQLHEDKSKTTIVELKTEGKDGRVKDEIK